MKRILSIVLLAVAASATMSAAEEARLLRFPSTNGEEVVFTYAGDLYKAPLQGGAAQRLTSHIGYEMFAKYSPDGRSIAFTGQYDGNTEVYLIPAEGGEPVRLSYTATNSRDDIGDRMGPNNIVMAWSPDGKSILFRNRISTSFDGKLLKIGRDGGMAEELPLPEGGFCCWSPDGKKLAYNRVFREFRNWKYYRGGMADDIWIYDPKAKKVENITSNEAQDIVPMWIGDEIFFISDRDMRMNLFVYNTKTKKTEKVTDFDDYDIKFPSTNGKIIVFEKGGYIYRFDPKERKAEKIEITLASDNIYARPELKDLSRSILTISPSSDGSRVALTARGEVFDAPVTEGVIKNLSRTPGAHERNAVCSPSGKYIAYISDRTGETEVWLQESGGINPRQLTKDNDTYIRRLFWNPDGSKLYYTDRKNRFVEVDPESGAKKTVMQRTNGEYRDIVFSADGKWLAYSESGANEMGVIYVQELASGKRYPVTENWYNSSSPIFSSDGRYLIFNSDRDLNPIYSSVEWNYAYNNMSALYVAMLSKETPSPFLPKDGVKAEAEKKGEAAVTTVKVDADGIERRIVKVPIQSGRNRAFYCDGKKIWYSAMRDVKTFDLASGEESTVAQNVSVSLSDNAKWAVFRKGSQIYVNKFPCNKANLDKEVPVKGVAAVIDYEQEWRQIYDEAWRAYRDGFYLENMHGVDWKAMYDKYAVFLPYVKTRLDLNYVIAALISELACGHAYVNPGNIERPARIDMGLLGAKISRDKSGNYRIDHIYEGAPYSKSLRAPLAEPGLGVKEGEYITAVDGMAVSEIDNIYKLLVGKADIPVELQVSSSATGKNARKVVVRPVSNEYPLIHHEWVQNNIKRVTEATEGKVGYIYIPDMSAEGLNEFVRYYYPQLDREALIIDDRANGGGNVSPMIIERLLREPYRMTMYRGTDRTGTIPEGTHVGPKVLLINKYSASDGDLFPWSFKANNLGTVIGTRTWGGIIGISGSIQYMDGTDIRVPFFTNYDAKTGEWIVENHGVDPDILIDNDPILEYQGVDQQLEKAIETALEQIKSRKPLPGVPAPRTFKDLHL